jgi:hypothetical protein
MSNITPIRVTGTLTPSGTQDVEIISPIPLPVVIVGEETFANAVNIYAEMLVPYGTVTTILSYTVPASVTFYCTQVNGWGDTCGEFLIKVDGVTAGGGRSTASDPNFFGNFVTAPIVATTGQVVTITAEQYQPSMGTYNMKANLMGGKL